MAALKKRALMLSPPAPPLRTLTTRASRHRRESGARVRKCSGPRGARQVRPTSGPAFSPKIFPKKFSPGFHEPVIPGGRTSGDSGSRGSPGDFSRSTARRAPAQGPKPRNPRPGLTRLISRYPGPRHPRSPVVRHPRAPAPMPRCPGARVSLSRPPGIRACRASRPGDSCARTRGKRGGWPLGISTRTA